MAGRADINLYSEKGKTTTIWSSSDGNSFDQVQSLAVPRYLSLLWIKESIYFSQGSPAVLVPSSKFFNESNLFWGEEAQLCHSECMPSPIWTLLEESEEHMAIGPMPYRPTWLLDRCWHFPPKTKSWIKLQKIASTLNSMLHDFVSVAWIGWQPSDQSMHSRKCSACWTALAEPRPL